MKENMLLSAIRDVVDKYDVISGKVFKKGTSEEIKDIYAEIGRTYMYLPKDVDTIVKGLMFSNKPEKWPVPELFEEGKTAGSIDIPFPLDDKQIIILNRMLYHPEDDSIFITTGIGGSGKSTFLNIIRQLFNDCSNCSLSDLTNGFMLAEAVKHRLICSDELAKGELNLPILKQLSSKQPISINGKFEKPYEIISQSELFYCCNKAPKLDITDSGIMRRIVYYERNTKIKNPDPSMKDRKYTHDELLSFCRRAWSIESKWKKENWFDYFRIETHKYIQKDNNVYLTYKYYGNMPDDDKYGYYKDACLTMGLKPYSEPVFDEVREQLDEWRKEDENDIIKGELF